MRNVAPHICFVCHEMPPYPQGGTGTVVINTARLCRDRGYRVTTVGIYDRDEVVDFEGITVHRRRASHVPFGPGYLNRLRLRSLIESIHEREPIDIVEASDWLGWVLPPRGASRPTLITRLDGSHTVFSGYDGAPRKERIHRYERRQLLASDYLLAPSAFTAAEIRRHFGLPHDRPPMQMMAFPVDCERFRPGERRQGRIFFAGTLTARKGVFPFMQAMIALLPDFPSVNVLLMGKDTRLSPDQPSVRAVLSAMVPEGLKSRFEFMDGADLDSFAQVLRTATIGVFPSLIEAFGMINAECMASAVPVISCRVGPIPEVIEDGVTGLLVEPGSADDIREAVRTLLADPQRATAMGLAGRQRVERLFSQARWREVMFPFYERVLAEKS